MSSCVNPLYYFSGTGGCLATAKRIAAELPEFKAVPIAALRGEASVAVDTDAVGLVFPLYYAGLPGIVAEFVKKLKFSKQCYVFAVVACGFPWSGYALHQLRGLLARKKQKLSVGCYLQMTDNFLPHYDVPNAMELDAIYTACDERLGRIVECVRRREIVMEKEKAFYLYAMYPVFIRMMKKYDRHFSVGDNCTSCGVCQKVCPVENVSLANGKTPVAPPLRVLPCLHLLLPAEGDTVEEHLTEKGQIPLQGRLCKRRSGAEDTGLTTESISAMKLPGVIS
jgi:ferredoxin